ncbi:MAG TPA: LysR family transcriptional regulator [Polyangia bacterium]|nr:LysR family transcriptional regulator [Polyangia bacterium]
MDAALIPAFHDALVVAQTGSVGEAARRLHKTASAVSQQIRRIEARFGLALFEKVGRGIRPSAAGEALLGSLTRLFDEAASLETLLDEMTAARVTTLRVAASDYLGEALLLPVLRRLFAQGAPLRFEITTTNSIEAGRLAADGQVDVAVISTDRPPSADETRLCAQRFFWVAPRVGGKRSAAPIRTRLGQEPLLRLRPGSQGRRILDELLGRLRLRPLSTIDLPSVSLLLSYVRQGLGIGLCPGLALRAGDRRQLAVEAADVPAIDVRLAWRPTLKRTPPIARFLDGLVEETRAVAGRS